MLFFIYGKLLGLPLPSVFPLIRRDGGDWFLETNQAVLSSSPPCHG